MSPKTHEQLALIREDRKKLILDVSLKLFAEKGYENTSISQITKEAGISKGLFYNYFESKEQLMQELVNLVFVEMGEGVEKVFAYQSGVDQPEKIIQEIILFLQKSIQEKTEFWVLYSRFAFQLRNHEMLKASFLEEEKAYNTAMANILADLNFENPEIEAIKFNNLLDGIALNYVLRPESYPLDDVIENVLKMYQARKE